MGCTQSCVTPVIGEGKALNDKIESQLKYDHMIAKNDIKMLLVDAGDSGKEFLLKQLSGGYKDSERVSYKEIIFSNTIQSMRAVLAAMPELDIGLQPGNYSRKTYMLSLPENLEYKHFPIDARDAIRGLWQDPGVREAVTRSPEFELNDSATYFFNAVDRMNTPGYLPTDKDILRSHVQTTGITETVFRVGEFTFKIVDFVNSGADIRSGYIFSKM